MGCTFFQLPSSMGFLEALEQGHGVQAERERSQHHSCFPVLLPEHHCCLSVFVINALQLYHPPSRFIGVIYRPPCLFRPLALGTLFLSNSSTTIISCAYSAYVAYNSHSQAHFHYPMILPSNHFLGHILDVIIS